MAGYEIKDTLINSFDRLRTCLSKDMIRPSVKIQRVSCPSGPEAVASVPGVRSWSVEWKM